MIKSLAIQLAQVRRNQYEPYILTIQSDALFKSVTVYTQQMILSHLRHCISMLHNYPLAYYMFHSLMLEQRIPDSFEYANFRQLIHIRPTDPVLEREWRIYRFYISNFNMNCIRLVSAVPLADQERLTILINRYDNELQTCRNYLNGTKGQLRAMFKGRNHHWAGRKYLRYAKAALIAKRRKSRL